MDRYLIINADDFGMCHSQNLAIMDLLARGSITSSTIMAPCAWAYEAAKFAAKNPQYAIGVHWTLTSEWGTYRWAPVCKGKEISSLCDETGYMWHESDQVEDEADIDEVEAEIREQIEMLKRLGLNPSHVDNHMGSLYGVQKGRLEFLNLAVDVAGEYGFPFRFPAKIELSQMDNETLDINIDKDFVAQMVGKFTQYADSKGVAMPDYLIPNEWNGPQKDSYENFREYLYELYSSIPEGVTETYLHPALESDELKAITGSWQRRVWEYNIMADPATKQHIEACGIKLINYRDLKKMRFGE